MARYPGCGLDCLRNLLFRCRVIVVRECFAEFRTGICKDGYAVTLCKFGDITVQLLDAGRAVSVIVDIREV